MRLATAYFLGKQEQLKEGSVLTPEEEVSDFNPRSLCLGRLLLYSWGSVATKVRPREKAYGTRVCVCAHARARSNGIRIWVVDRSVRKEGKLSFEGEERVAVYAGQCFFLKQNIKFCFAPAINRGKTVTEEIPGF